MTCRMLTPAYALSYTLELISPLYSNTMQTHRSLSCFVVWEYVLLQFSSPSTLFLSTISRQSLSIQESAKEKRKSPYMLS